MSLDFGFRSKSFPLILTHIFPRKFPQKFSHTFRRYSLESSRRLFHRYCHRLTRVPHIVSQTFPQNIPLLSRPSFQPCPPAAPAVSFVVPNAPSSGGISLTVAGLSFATADYTPTAVVAATLCATAAWASATSVLCQAAHGVGTSLSVVVTTSTAAGTAFGAFSFDGGGCPTALQSHALQRAQFSLLCQFIFAVADPRACRQHPR